MLSMFGSSRVLFLCHLAYLNTENLCEIFRYLGWRKEKYPLALVLNQGKRLCLYRMLLFKVSTMLWTSPVIVDDACMLNLILLEWAWAKLVSGLCNNTFALLKCIFLVSGPCKISNQMDIADYITEVGLWCCCGLLGQKRLPTFANRLWQISSF